MTDLGSAIDRMTGHLQIAVRAAMHERPREVQEIVAAVFGFAIALCDLYKIVPRELFDAISPPPKRPYTKPSLRVLGRHEPTQERPKLAEGAQEDRSRPELSPEDFAARLSEWVETFQGTLEDAASSRDARGRSMEDSAVGLLVIAVRRSSDGTSHALLERRHLPRDTAAKALRVALERLAECAPRERGGMH